MSKKYYISPIVGDGSEMNPYRAKISDYGKSWTGTIPSDPVTGIPLFDWALCIVSSVDHGLIVADRTIDRLPEVSLDIKVSAIGPAAKSRLDTAISARGIDSQVASPSNSYRDVINGIGRHLSPGFDVDSFDVN